MRCRPSIKLALAARLLLCDLITTDKVIYNQNTTPHYVEKLTLRAEISQQHLIRHYYYHYHQQTLLCFMRITFTRNNTTNTAFSYFIRERYSAALLLFIMTDMKHTYILDSDWFCPLLNYYLSSTHFIIPSKHERKYKIGFCLKNSFY